MNLSRYLVLFFLFSIVNSCVEPYDAKVKKGEERIVVEGWITDQPGPYTIRLSKTSNYSWGYEGVNFGVKGAKISIKDDLGNTATFNEDKSGYYKTEEGAIKGESGRTYQLTIQIGEKVYQSTPETMQEVPAIDSLYYEYKGSVFFNPPGFYVYLNTTDPAEATNYYLWKWEGYTERRICKYGTYTALLCCVPCWDIDRDSSTLYMNSDHHVAGNQIIHQEVAVIPYLSRSRVAVKVSQLSLSAGVYKFLGEIKAEAENTGSVFDKIPATIKGNVINIDDPSDSLLGFFSVSAVRERFLNVDRLGVKTDPPPAPKAPIIENDACAACEETDLTTARIPLSWSE